METDVDLNPDVTFTLNTHSDINIAIPSEQQCTSQKCIEIPDLKTLLCDKCKRKVHLQCTLLPTYQLQRYLSSGIEKYYSKYICMNCVKISSELENTYSTSSETNANENVISLKNEITLQKETIEACKLEIKELRELLSTYSLTEDAKGKKKRKIGETYIQPEPKAIENDMMNELNDKINETINCRFERLESTVNAFIEKQLTRDEKITKQGDEQKSFANVLKTNNAPEKSFRDILLAAKNEELVEEKEKTYRQNNIIIHGQIEENKEEQTDKKYVDDMLKILSVGSVTPKSITRIGQQKESRIRPIKVTFNTTSEKDKVMSNLRNLKDQTEYSKISITDDYTLNERKMIRDKVVEAKEENIKLGEDSEFINVVRGTPKNGLYLKKVKRNN